MDGRRTPDIVRRTDSDDFNDLLKDFNLDQYLDQLSEFHLLQLISYVDKILHQSVLIFKIPECKVVCNKISII